VNGVCRETYSPKVVPGNGAGMCKTLSLFAWLVTAAVLGLPAERTGAFEVVSTGTPNEYLKWGSTHQAGSSGGVVTWGLVSVGTPGSSYCSIFCVGESTDVLPNFYATPDINNTTTPVTLAALEPVIEQAFAAWSAVADVEFRYVGEDRSLKPVNDPTAASPMIRIGIWPFEGLTAYFVAGAAFPPGLNDGNGAGHIFLNSNVGFQLSGAGEGSRLQDFPTGGGLYMSDVYLLALHEIGHVIGLAGSNDPESLMWNGGPSAVLRPTYMWRTPRADDIAGARFLYGAPRKPGVP
jgi:hypothetical protein